jgi:hypothetical protein
MTAVPGLCKVTVGYNSSSAGTNRGSVKDGGVGPILNGGVLGRPLRSIDVGEPTGVGKFVTAISTAVAVMGRVDTGGLTICWLTENVTAAVTDIPSHVS